MVRRAGHPDAQTPRRRSTAQNPEAIFGGWRFDSHDRFRGILRPVWHETAARLPPHSTDKFIRAPHSRSRRQSALGLVGARDRAFIAAIAGAEMGPANLICVGTRQVR